MCFSWSLSGIVKNRYKKITDPDHLGGTRLKFESRKVRIHTKNASQTHFYYFLKDI